MFICCCREFDCLQTIIMMMMEKLFSINGPNIVMDASTKSIQLWPSYDGPLCLSLLILNAISSLHQARVCKNFCFKTFFFLFGHQFVFR